MHTHYVKNVLIRSFSGLYFPTIGLNTEYLSVFSPNAEKYRPENHWIQTLFTQWFWPELICLHFKILQHHYHYKLCTYTLIKMKTAREMKDIFFVLICRHWFSHTVLLKIRLLEAYPYFKVTKCDFSKSKIVFSNLTTCISF